MEYAIKVIDQAHLKALESVISKVLPFQSHYALESGSMVGNGPTYLRVCEEYYCLDNNHQGHEILNTQQFLDKFTLDSYHVGGGVYLKNKGAMYGDKVYIKLQGDSGICYSYTEEALTTLQETTKLEPSVLPKKWAIKITAENLYELNEWRTPSVNIVLSDVGSYLLNEFHKVIGWYTSEIPEGYTEITTEEFRRRVYNNTDSSQTPLEDINSKFISGEWYIIKSGHNMDSVVRLKEVYKVDEIKLSFYEGFTAALEGLTYVWPYKLDDWLFTIEDLDSIIPYNIDQIRHLFPKDHSLYLEQVELPEVTTIPHKGLIPIVEIIPKADIAAQIPIDKNFRTVMPIVLGIDKSVDLNLQLKSKKKSNFLTYNK